MSSTGFLVGSSSSLACSASTSLVGASTFSSLAALAEGVWLPSAASIAA